MNWLKRYWAELAVFGVISGVLLLLANPDFTWINTDSDGIHYTYAAKYLYPAHKTSAPLFLLLGHLFLKIPFGTDAWRFALLSVLASTGSAVFIYLIIKEKLKENNSKRTYALIGSLIFGSSALVISQSTIIETYALVTMFGLAAYYFSIKKQWAKTALMLGAGGAVHHLIGIPIIVLWLLNKDFRQWKYFGIMAAFLVFYLYIPLSAAILKPPDIWGNQTLPTFFADNISTALMLIGRLSIWDLPKRILDSIGVVGISLGLALIPIFWFIRIRHDDQNPVRTKHYKEPLLWLFFLPIIYYATNLAPQTYVYMMPAIGFGAIIAAVGLTRMESYWKPVILGTTIVMLIFNTNYFDIGRTLDPGLSASKYYYEELDKVPDGEILIARQGWEWAAIPAYNKGNNRNIIAVSVGTLPSPYYQEQLKESGVKFISYKDSLQRSQPTLIAQSIAKLNSNVWITKTTVPKTYGAEIVHYKGNEDLLTLPQIVTTNGIIDIEWAWKPSNPYNIITGAIEVEQWTWIIISNYSMLTFAMLGIIGMIPVWLGYMLIIRRKKWSLKRKEPSLLKTAE